MKIVSRINKSIKILSLTAVIGVGFAMPAFAIDGDTFFERIKSDMKKVGYNIEAGKISVDGSNINASDVKIMQAVKNDKNQTLVKEIVFENVEEDKDGGYLIGRVVIDNFEVGDVNENKRLTLQGYEVTKLLIKSEKNEAAYEGQAAYEKMSIKKINIEKNGKVAAVLDNLSIGFVEYVPNKTIKYTGEIGSLKFDVDCMDHGARDAFTKMGYSNLELQTNFAYALNFDDSSMDLTLQGNMNDVGQLNIALKFSGVTKDIFDEFIRISKQANDASKEAEETVTVALLGLIQQLSLNLVDVKFSDKSITNKVIDLQKGSNETRENFVGKLKLFVNLGLSQLESPDFSEKAASEIGKYLDNPQNIEISAKPDQGTPFAVIVSTAISSKKDLIDLLKVNVQANQ